MPCVTLPATVLMSTVPPPPALTVPARTSALLSTTASRPPVVMPAIVPIWFAVPRNDAPAAMPPVLVNVPAINVPVVPCVTLPADDRSTVAPFRIPPAFN